jgi:hypothetical protein
MDVVRIMDVVHCTRRCLLGLGALYALDGCRASEGLEIAAIDAEGNRYLLSPHVDPGLYSRREPMQYFLVAGFDALPAQQAQAAIDAFVRDSFRSSELAHVVRLNILFYRKPWFANYKDDIYEAARSEFGYLPDQRDKLAAQVRLERIPGRRDEWRRHRAQYSGEQSRYTVSDTIDAAHLFGS